MKLDYIITTITNDSVKSRTIECMELARWMLFRENIGFYWNVSYGDGKARSRSIAASRFLTETEAEYLCFIDSDILFTPDNLKRLFEDLRAGYDLIGGIFSVRGGTQASSFGLDYRLILDGKIHEFEYIATGFVGISRKLLKKILDETKLALLHPHDMKFWPFFEERQYPDRDGEGIFLSEDYDFCEKARAVGVKPYIDTSIQPGHLGEIIFTMEDVVKHQKEEMKRHAKEPMSDIEKARRAIQSKKNASSKRGAPMASKK